MTKTLKDFGEKFVVAYIASLIVFTVLMFATDLVRTAVYKPFSLFWMTVTIYSAIYATLFAAVHITMRPHLQTALCAALFTAIGAGLTASAGQPLFGLFVLPVLKQSLFAVALIAFTYGGLHISNKLA